MEHGHSLPQEERGAYFGRVFVLLALIEAGKVKTEVCVKFAKMCNDVHDERECVISPSG